MIWMRYDMAWYDMAYDNVWYSQYSRFIVIVGHHHGPVLDLEAIGNFKHLAVIAPKSSTLTTVTGSFVDFSSLFVISMEFRVLCVKEKRATMILGKWCSKFVSKKFCKPRIRLKSGYTPKGCHIFFSFCSLEFCRKFGDSLRSTK